MIFNLATGPVAQAHYINGVDGRTESAANENTIAVVWTDDLTELELEVALEAHVYPALV